MPAQVNALVESLALRRTGSAAEERVFSPDRWHKLLDQIEDFVGAFHRARPTLAGASPEDIERGLQPYVDSEAIEAAASELVDTGRLARRGARLHLPSHTISIDEKDRQLLDRAATLLAPASGSPPSLHQAAEALGVDKKVLETALKRAGGIGEMAAIARNRYVPVDYLTRLAQAAEMLGEKSVENGFTAAEFCAQTGIGRNFAIDLLEHFDRLGFTDRDDNHRRVKRPFASAGKN